MKGATERKSEKEIREGKSKCDVGCHGGGGGEASALLNRVSRWALLRR